MKQKNPSDNSSPATVPRLVVQAAAALLLWGVVLFGITTAINESPLTGFTLPAWLLVVVDVATKQVAIPFVIGVISCWAVAKVFGRLPGVQLEAKVGAWQLSGNPPLSAMAMDNIHVMQHRSKDPWQDTWALVKPVNTSPRSPSPAQGASVPATKLPRRSGSGALVDAVPGGKGAAGAGAGGGEVSPKGARRSIGGRGSTGGALPKGLLPPGNAAAASWGPGRKLPYSQTPESQGRMLVLAADDGPMNAAVISMLLETDPRFQLLVVGSGAEVLQYVAQAEHLPDVILLDVLLPDATGPEVVHALRAKYNPMQLPIIAIGGRSGEEELVQSLEAGANDFYVKPLSKVELVARIDAQVKVQRSVAIEAEARVHYALLSQVLPPHIISHLALGSHCIAEKHSQVTLLFSDIVGFTEISSEWRTELVVTMLDMMFSRFDELCAKHGVFKVETIGDAYMVVAGHDGDRNHAQRMVDMAVDMLRVVEDLQGKVGPAAEASSSIWNRGTDHSLPLPAVMHDGVPVDLEEAARLAEKQAEWKLQIRIGIHTGPAYSGVVGKERPRYCFFGDTVNTASRMESNSWPMCVHMSANTHAALMMGGGCAWEMFDCGVRLIKGKGEMRTYVLNVGDAKGFLDALRREAQEEADSCPSTPRGRRSSVIVPPPPWSL